MKRLLCFAAICLFSAAILSSCIFYTHHSAEYYIDGKIGVYAYKTSNSQYAEVTDFKFDITGEYDVITIPDEYDGVPITDIGGRYYYVRCEASPTGSGLAEYGNRYVNFRQSIIGRSSFNVYINVGKNVRTIRNPYNIIFTKDAGDGTYYAYDVCFIWNVSEENEKYFSSGGVLYEKDRDGSHIVEPYDSGIIYKDVVAARDGKNKTRDAISSILIDCSSDGATADISNIAPATAVGGSSWQANVRPYGDGVITVFKDDEKIIRDERYDVKIIVKSEFETVNIADFWFLRQEGDGYVRYVSNISYEYKDQNNN